jgi:ABC-type transporter Mla MlaB component
MAEVSTGYVMIACSERDNFMSIRRPPAIVTGPTRKGDWRETSGGETRAMTKSDDRTRRTARIRASGQLDRAAATSLGAQAIAAARSCDDVVLDLSRVTHIDGSAVATVAGVAVRCAQQTRLHVVPPTAPSRDSWSLMGAELHGSR